MGGDDNCSREKQKENENIIKAAEPCKVIKRSQNESKEDSKKDHKVEDTAELHSEIQLSKNNPSTKKEENSSINTKKLKEVVVKSNKVAVDKNDNPTKRGGRQSRTKPENTKTATNIAKTVSLKNSINEQPKDETSKVTAISESTKESSKEKVKPKSKNSPVKPIQSVKDGPKIEKDKKEVDNTVK